jgi:hypothetical protein
VLTDISWSIDPDDWEAARTELADIIESFYTGLSQRIYLPMVTTDGVTLQDKSLADIAHR